MISAFAGMSFWRTFDSTCVLYLCRRNCAQGELEKTREFSTHLSLFCHWRADKMLFVRLYNIDSTTSVFSFHLYHVRNDCSALSFLHIECFFPSTSLWSFVNRNSVQYAYWFSSTNICCQLLPHPVVWMSTNSFYCNGHHVRCSWLKLVCRDTGHQHTAEARVTAVHAACSSKAMTRSSVSFLVLTLCFNEDYMSC